MINLFTMQFKASAQKKWTKKLDQRHLTNKGSGEEDCLCCDKRPVFLI